MWLKYDSYFDAFTTKKYAVYAQWKFSSQKGMKINFWLKLDSNLGQLEFPQASA